MRIFAASAAHISVYFYYFVELVILSEQPIFSFTLYMKSIIETGSVKQNVWKNESIAIVFQNLKVWQAQFL